MAVEAYLPMLNIVVISGLIDSINLSCTIGLMILMVFFLITSKKSTSIIIILGSVYIISVAGHFLIKAVSFNSTDNSNNPIWS